LEEYLVQEIQQRSDLALRMIVLFQLTANGEHMEIGLNVQKVAEGELKLQPEKSQFKL
jgi:uncharacterized protein YeaC (DUF1315 family)